MPKRKTADANVEVNSAPARSRKASANTSHKRTTTRRTTETSASTEVAAAVQPAREFVPTGTTESVLSTSLASPSHDEIARRAYSYFEARGFQTGDPVHDWLRAERELGELAKNR